MYSRQTSVWMVKPGGTGSPALVISASPAPLPPRTSFIFPLPSALPPPNEETYLVGVFFVSCGSTSGRVIVGMTMSPLLQVLENHLMSVSVSILGGAALWCCDKSNQGFSPRMDFNL